MLHKTPAIFAPRYYILPSLRDFRISTLPQQPWQPATATLPAAPTRMSAVGCTSPAHVMDPFPALKRAAIDTSLLHEVHIWWLQPSIALSCPRTLEACAAVLATEETADCMKARNATTRHLRLLARAFARSVLARYASADATTLDSGDASVHPSGLVFVRNAHGKPELQDLHHGVKSDVSQSTSAEQTSLRPLRFNLTHTGGLVGLAVARGRAVGLDAESVERRTRDDPLRVARRHFSAEEVRQLEDAPDETSRGLHFIKLWTLKEAYVKAVGRGIAASPGMSGFAFRFVHSKTKIVEEHGSGGLGSGCDDEKIWFESSTEKDPGQWSFALMRPTEHHVSAICCERSAGGPVFRIRTFVYGGEDGAVREMPVLGACSDGIFEGSTPLSRL